MRACLVIRFLDIAVGVMADGSSGAPAAIGGAGPAASGPPEPDTRGSGGIGPRSRDRGRSPAGSAAGLAPCCAGRVAVAPDEQNAWA